MEIRVVTPWYPDYANPYSGIFVKQQVRALQALGQPVSVDVLQLFPAPPSPIPSTVLDATEHMAAENPRSFFTVDGSTTYIPTPVPAGSGVLGRAHSFSRELALKQRALPSKPDIAHAHLGVPTGLAMLDVDSVPLVVTEHQSQLRTLLSNRQVAAAYERTLDSARGFVCVSPVLRDVIARGLGQRFAERVEIIPNIVDLGDLPYVDHTGTNFQKWLYVGGLFEHKGIGTLLKSFHAYRTEHDGAATLTLVGEGPMRSWIETYARRHGLAEVVHLAGALDHGELQHFYGAADVFVHLSPYETFGIASLEAVGSGLPVVSLRNSGAEAAWGTMEQQCGVLLPSKTRPIAVAAAVLDLRNRADSLDLSSGRRFVENEYSPLRVATSLMRLYERVLA